MKISFFNIIIFIYSWQDFRVSQDAVELYKANLYTSTFDPEISLSVLAAQLQEYFLGLV